MKKRINDVVYWIQQEGQRKLKVVHRDRLAKYSFTHGFCQFGTNRLKEEAVLHNMEHSHTVDSVVLHASRPAPQVRVSAQATLKYSLVFIKDAYYETLVISLELCRL